MWGPGEAGRTPARQGFPHALEVGTRIASRARLEARREEIETALLTRVFAIDDPRSADPTYAEALPSAVSAALDYGLEGVRRDHERAIEVPPVLLAQARLAARVGVTLDTVLRRYIAGYLLLADFLVEEAQLTELVRSSELKRVLRAQAVLFERLLNAVSEEYSREGHSWPPSPARHRIECVERLLAGELTDASVLAYDFDGWHVGAIIVGEQPEAAVHHAVDGVDCQLLLVVRDERTVWAWMGSRRRLDPDELEVRARSERGPKAVVALGEVAKGIAGWRSTHHQAATILPLMKDREKEVARYADLALLATIHRDDLLSTSLRQLYLSPLEEERDGGEAARQTLRAYFAAERNISSAAVALGVNRNTVTNRLQGIEDRIGRPIASCAAELEAALRLEELGKPAHAGRLAVR